MWETIFYASITFGVLLSIMLMIYYVYSARLVKKRRMEFVALHESMKVGKYCLFAGGIRGRLVRVGEEYCDVEVAKDQVLTVSRYAISSIEA
ncbi:MAG: preprotein translocase subunit YajC [Erysipelotrichaceae bacterium]